MNDLEAASSSHRCKVPLYLLVFFRYAVLASTAIACYCLCYLAYEHDNHHCADYPYRCTEAQKKNIEKPWAEVIFIWACVFSTLESIFSTFHLIRSSSIQIPYKRLLISTAPITLLYLLSYWMFYNLPSVKLPCPWGPNATTRNLKDAPETYDCCIALGVVIAGGIGLFFQILITVMAAIGVLPSGNKGGKLSLKEISDVIAAAVNSEKVGIMDGDETLDEEQGKREVLVVI